MSLTTIATFSFPYEAQIARARLDSEGIPAFIADEHTINANWLYSNAFGGVRLQVPRELAGEAYEILREDHSEELVNEQGIDSVKCSRCGSSNTEYHQKDRRWAFLVFLCLEFPLFPVKHTFTCKDCGYVEGT
jgi:Putative prokaryotic signal transducing protein